jgi:flavin reductase (DIM6/NTAB) family NADH-FMN oxidoreductase RutF
MARRIPAKGDFPVKSYEIGADPKQWRELYGLFIGFVNPRPIALVSTMSPEGTANLAPYSFYNLVSAQPPVVVLGPSLRPDGSPKDSLRNIEATGEFVIATVTTAIVRQAVDCATPLPYGTSEFDWSGLSAVPAQQVRAPLVRESPVNMECTLREVLRFGSNPGAGNAVLGDVRRVHVDESVLDARGRVDPRRMPTVGRLGGKWYCTVSQPYELEIPPADGEAPSRRR